MLSDTHNFTNYFANNIQYLVCIFVNEISSFFFPSTVNNSVFSVWTRRIILINTFTLMIMLSEQSGLANASNQVRTVCNVNLYGYFEETCTLLVLNIVWIYINKHSFMKSRLPWFSLPKSKSCDMACSPWMEAKLLFKHEFISSLHVQGFTKWILAMTQS